MPKSPPLTAHEFSCCVRKAAAKVITLASFLIVDISTILAQHVQAGTFKFDGKCGLLFDSSYQEQCTALFDDDILTLMPKGARQIRILPQQIVYIALADKSTLKMDENIALYNKMVPWWQPWNKVPGWVKDATKEKAELHQFSIGYVDKDFNPKIVLFILEDKGRAGAMASELQSSSGLMMGQKRTAKNALDQRLISKLTKEAQRKAKRLNGLCSQYMFDDAEPIADELDIYVKNTSTEIEIFDGADSATKSLRAIANQAINYCDSQIKAEIAQAAAEERARLQSIRRARAAAAAAAISRANRAAAAERQARRSAWDNLAGS